MSTILSSRARLGVTPDADFSLTALLVGPTGGLRSWLEQDMDAARVWWLADSATTLLPPGPGKVHFLVIGDGFGVAGQDVFDSRVENEFLPPHGLFAHDFFALHADSFALTRLNFTSVDDEAGRVVYARDSSNELVEQGDGTYEKSLDEQRDTPFGYRTNSAWELCWQEQADDTEVRLQRALGLYGIDYDLLIIVINTPDFCGCGGGARSIVSLPQLDWPTIAHEQGHSLGGLGDEYGAGGAGVFAGAEPPVPNLTANSDRDTLKWRKYVAADTPLPSGAGDWSNGPKPSDWDDSASVGLFEGGALYDPASRQQVAYGTGLFRPVINCRMNSNVPQYCPVCADVMAARLAQMQQPDHAAGGAVSGSRTPGERADVGYVRMVVRHEADGSLRVLASAPVDGALRVRTVPPGARLAARLRVGESTVATQPLPDADLHRAANGPGDPRHHTVRVPVFDFEVRLPSDELSSQDVRDMALDLLRFDDDTDRPAGRARRDSDDAPSVIATLQLADDSVDATVLSRLVTHLEATRHDPARRRRDV